jgi:DNA-binding transcriptional LysR family regulator
MNVRLLKSFIAVCESRNVTESAERMHISQPALSRRVAELQRMLGLELFERDGRRLRPNHAAIEILPIVQEAVDALQRLHEAARALTGRTGRTIKLGATSQLVESLLANFVAGYGNRHPDLHLSLIEAGGSEMSELLLDRTIDVGLTSEPGPDSQLRSRRLGKMRILAFGAPESALDGPFIAFDRLCAERILILSHRFESRRIFETICRTHGLKPRIAFEAGSAHALLAAARAGLGVAVLPSTVAVDMPSATILLDDRPVEFTLAAIWDCLGDKELLVMKLLDVFERYVRAFQASRTRQLRDFQY